MTREQSAQAIINSPQDYVVCDGCGSILRATSRACPACNGYRFDASKERVIAQAALLLSRPSTAVEPRDMV